MGYPWHGRSRLRIYGCLRVIRKGNQETHMEKNDFGVYKLRRKELEVA